MSKEQIPSSNVIAVTFWDELVVGGPVLNGAYPV